MRALTKNDDRPTPLTFKITEKGKAILQSGELLPRQRQFMHLLKQMNEMSCRALSELIKKVDIVSMLTNGWITIIHDKDANLHGSCALLQIELRRIVQHFESNNVKKGKSDSTIPTAEEVSDYVNVSLFSGSQILKPHAVQSRAPICYNKFFERVSLLDSQQSNTNDTTNIHSINRSTQAKAISVTNDANKPIDNNPLIVHTNEPFELGALVSNKCFSCYDTEREYQEDLMISANILSFQ